MFSDLVISHDKKTNRFIGGGYTLNSSFLNAGIPPMVSQSGGNGLKTKSRSRSRSRSPSSDIDDTMTVSSLFERSNASSGAVVIPAGLFMIHPDAAGNDANKNKDTILTKRIERFLHDGDSGDSGDSGDNDMPGDEPRVVPSDLYERLFSMLSPSQSDAKQYWHPKAVTRSNNGKHNKVGRATRRVSNNAHDK